MAEVLPSQIDYTSRDFRSLREDLLARMAVAVPDWDPSDPSDFGVVLVEAFAHLGDIMSYYIDRAANESSLSTATRRSSVLALARDLGYEPSGYASSGVAVTFTNNGGSEVVIPAQTVVTANVERDDYMTAVPFETSEEITVPSGGTATGSATQGETILGPDGYGESIGVSTGSPRQFMRLFSENVIKTSVAVYVYDGVNYYPWSQTAHLSDHLSTSRVFRVVDDGYDGVYVEFGDGTSGAIPLQGHVVYATYRTCVGTSGNVSINTITEITSVPGLSSEEVSVLIGSLSVTNESAATGGADPEDLQSIRSNAALAYRTNNRAVSLDDYKNLSLQVSGCGKASATASTPALVLLTVAPSRNLSSAEARPGFTETSPGVWASTPEYDSLKERVLNYVNSRRLAGVTVVMTDPVYTNIEIVLDVTVPSGVLLADVETIFKRAVIDRLDYSRVGFGATITPSDIVGLLSSLGVADSVTVTTLKRSGDVADLTTIVADEDEILLLAESDISLATGG